MKPNHCIHATKWSGKLDNWESRKLVEHGFLGIALRLRRSFSHSRAEQIVRLYADTPRIDFETWVNWQETERVLKVAFRVTVESRIYMMDTSAGVPERENHRNTDWQEARFEVCDPLLTSRSSLGLSA